MLFRCFGQPCNISILLEQDMVEGIYELILETVLSQKEQLCIARDSYPAELVRARFLKLEYGHVEYVISCLKENTSKVRNIKKYMLAAFVSFGGILRLIGGILGILFAGSSILCLIMGLVSGREFWEMFLLGIAFGAIPTMLRMCGESGIYAIRSILGRIGSALWM